MFQSSEAFQVTADNIDPLYNKPVIDARVEMSVPTLHYKISGHFEGTDKRFTFYFPPKLKWKHKFFHLVYPLFDEIASDDLIEFACEHGAYAIQTNGGGGYRVDAAAAKYSKVVAANYYNDAGRIYGYIYGGSGGSYQTIGAIENTMGVWDGAVPFIPGVPISLPNNAFIRAFARFVLQTKIQAISDALSPGGHGNPYAGLTEIEASVLKEVTNLGVPLRGWEDYEYLLRDSEPLRLLDFGYVVRNMDPTYVEAFWNEEGYIGAENSPLGEFFRSAKIDVFCEIAKVIYDASDTARGVMLQCDSTIKNIDYVEFTLYSEDEQECFGTILGTLDLSTMILTLADKNTEEVLSQIKENAKLRIDNRWNLAILSYHRHQIPSRAGYYSRDQYKTTAGELLFPQRPIEVGPALIKGVSGGGTHSGAIKGNVILVANLLDVDAYPWHADWYSNQVKAALGEKFHDQFRVWINDHADHIENGPRTFRLVQYDSILKQALLDLSNWVEQGIAPAQSTQYEVLDGQIIVPASADERQGIQPVVELKVNEGDSIVIHAGETVSLTAKVEVPSGYGQIIEIEWDFAGDGQFVEYPLNKIQDKLELSIQHAYDKPGVYFVAVRVSSQRHGDRNDRFTQIQNLGRVRVTVQ